MSPEQATSQKELVKALVETEEAIVPVPRVLLVNTIGPQEASRFLPALPDFVHVNKDNLLLVLRFQCPDLLKEVLDEQDPR